MARLACWQAALASLLVFALRAAAKTDDAYLVGTGELPQYACGHCASPFLLVPLWKHHACDAGIADVTGPAADVEMMVSLSRCPPPPPPVPLPSLA